MNHCKTLFLALDSADPTLLTQWMEDGSLPNLQALHSRSAHGRLETPRCLGSDAIWPSVFTGVDPSKHGLYHHKQAQAGSYRDGSQRRMDLERAPIWQILSEANRRVAVLDMPKAPMTEGLNGIQVLDWHSHYSYTEEFRTWPPEQKQILTEAFGPHTTCPCLAARYQDYDPKNDSERINGLLRNVDETLEMLLYQLDNGPWDLMMATFGASHCVGHQFWHLHDTTHPRRDSANNVNGDPLRRVYIAIDAALGKLLNRLDDDSSVVLFAGAGLGPNYVGRELLDEILARLDQSRPSAARKTVKWLKSVWYQLPAGWRKRLSSIAHLTENNLNANDRSKRRFFAVQANDTVGGIRINLQGREPNGQVAPELLAATCDELINAITKIRITDSGAPLVRDIVRTDTIYQGEYLDQLPDILIEWNHEAPIHSISSPDFGTMTQDWLPDWSGTHRSGALVMLSVQGIAPCTLPSGSTIYDVAPTLAALCNTRLPDVDGHSLIDVLTKPFPADPAFDL